MRTLVVGDIHSGLRALEQVLERAGVGPQDHLIFLGDYVDGWSTAVETVNYLIGLRDRFQCTFLRGNHDALCQEWLLTQKENVQWLQNGGLATRNSYLATDRGLWDLHLQFFEGLENFHEQRDERLFVHAGFTNLNGIQYEYYRPYHYWDRTLWELAKALNPALQPGDPDYPKRLGHYKEIFIGHTPLSRSGTVPPRRAGNVWNVDTGAAFKGGLCLMDVDTKAYWQSDPVHTFYPGERGRN